MTAMSSRFPFSPFPTGWYALCASDELAPGQLRTLTFMGEEVVVFRAGNGTVAVADAHCPHLGAHFGHGGTVAGDTLRCPFHGFCFDTAGTCVSTAYGHAPPSAARLRVWPCRERNGFVLAWYHRDGAAPDWEVPVIAETEGWSPLRVNTFTLRGHPQETTENSVDIGHFVVVHSYTAVATLRELVADGPTLGVRYTMTRRAVFPPNGKPFRTEFDVHVHGLGWSFVEVEIPTLGMRTRQYVLATPIDGERISLRIAVAAKLPPDRTRVSPFLMLVPHGLATRLVAEGVFRATVGDVSQDIAIWENKQYIEPPALARGDGPVGRYRQWARQFYPEPAARPELPGGAVA
jgi:nitrite reductase/ring-hydroxylating ferredoxin subunit